jgi:signal transduction histidine kinase
VIKPQAAERSRARTQKSAAVEEVRREVARELHDRVAQTLTGMLVDVENFKSEQVGWDDVLRELSTIQDSTREVLYRLRQLLLDLRNEEIRRTSLVDSVVTLAASFQAQTGIATDVTVDPGWPPAFPDPLATNLIRIVEEALVNIKKHSGARRAQIALETGRDGCLTLKIADDGRGIMSESQWLGLGTLGMRERVVVLGGRLVIQSGAEGGTAVIASFPSRHLDVIETSRRDESVAAAPELQAAEVSA